MLYSHGMGRTREEREMDYCDQGHPEHDASFGCGPCSDEEAAGYGEWLYALPVAVRDMLAAIRSER